MDSEASSERRKNAIDFGRSLKTDGPGRGNRLNNANAVWGTSRTEERIFSNFRIRVLNIYRTVRRAVGIARIEQRRIDYSVIRVLTSFIAYVNVGTCCRDTAVTAAGGAKRS